MRGRHLVFISLATLLAASIPLWVSPPQEVHGAVNQNITLLDSLAFEPDSFTAAPGESVSLTLSNGGNFDHTFTLFGQVDAVVPVDNFNDLMAYYNANSKIVDKNLSGGGQDSATFTAPTAEGTYTFVCMEPGHTPTMVGTMTVTSGTPPPGGIDPLLIGVVVAVVVLVIAVATVFILRRRS
ncbi:MAG: plastocyanin/azurin family copper-binding protein [Thermoplasmata archaeon]